VPAARAAGISKSLIPKSGRRFSDEIMLNKKSWSAIAVQRNVIALQRAAA
jgi:hypothetical protein